MSIDNLRKQINLIDEKMVKLFEQRMQVVIEIARYKRIHDLNVFDPKREKQVIANNLSYLKDKALEKHYLELLQTMFKVSKDYQLEIINNKE